MTISTALKQEKNKLSNINPWVILLEVHIDDNAIPDPIILYLCSNVSAVSYGDPSHDYQPFPMMLNLRQENLSGKIPSVTISVSNVDRSFQGYLEATTPPGAVDCHVKMTIVNLYNLSDDFSDFESNFKILGTSADNQWVTFELGLLSPLSRRFPLYRTMGLHCGWIFKSYQCGYAGATETCNKTLATCQGFNDPDTSSQSRRFGGFPGLSQSGVRFVK